MRIIGKTKSLTLKNFETDDFLQVLTVMSPEGAMEKTEDEQAPPAIPNITMVGMVVAIVVSAVICFVIGLIVHNLYRKHRKKRVSLE